MKIYFCAEPINTTQKCIFVGEVEDEPNVNPKNPYSYSADLNNWVNNVRNPFISATVRNLAVRFQWLDAVIMKESRTVNGDYYVFIQPIEMLENPEGLV